jgi:hypothetical protein
VAWSWRSWAQGSVLSQRFTAYVRASWPPRKRCARPILPTGTPQPAPARRPLLCRGRPGARLGGSGYPVARVGVGARRLRGGREARHFINELRGQDTRSACVCVTPKNTEPRGRVIAPSGLCGFCRELGQVLGRSYSRSTVSDASSRIENPPTPAHLRPKPGPWRPRKQRTSSPSPKDSGRTHQAPCATIVYVEISKPLDGA